MHTISSSSKNPKEAPTKRSLSSSEDSSDHHRPKKTKRKKSRKRSDSSSSEEAAKHKRKKHSKKHKKKSKKEKKKRRRDVGSSSDAEEVTVKKEEMEENKESIEIPLTLMSKAMAPMTKEQWEKQQSIVRKVYDETTGRHRLIKGDGEVIEEIVSRERHKEINQQATRGDGDYFQRKTARKE